jgi:hypothetical protein
VALHSGHHRVWAAHRLGIDSIPAIETCRPRPWCWLQSHHETRWAHIDSAGAPA